MELVNNFCTMIRLYEKMTRFYLISCKIRF